MSKPATSSSEGCRISGWITKRGAFVHNHKLRYGYLFPDRLDYYDKPLPQGEMKGSWSLTNFSTVLVNKQRANHGWIRLVHDTDTSRDRFFEPQDQFDSWMEQLKSLVSGKSFLGESISSPTLLASSVAAAKAPSQTQSPSAKPPAEAQNDRSKTPPKADRSKTPPKADRSKTPPKAEEPSSPPKKPQARLSVQLNQKHHRLSTQTAEPLNLSANTGAGASSQTNSPRTKTTESVRLPSVEEKIHVSIINEKQENQWQSVTVRLDPTGFSFPEFFIESNRIRWASLMPHDELFEIDENGDAVWAAKYGMAPFNTSNFDAILFSYWEDDNPCDFYKHKIADLGFISIPIIIPRKRTRFWLDTLLWYSTRDWNWEYQEIRELLRTSDMHENPEEVYFNYSKLLSNLVEDFELQAMHIVRTVVSELAVPDEERKIVSVSRDQYGRDIFKFNNIIFKLSVDGISLFDGADWCGKMTSNEFKAGCALEYSLRKTWKNFIMDTEEGTDVHNPKQGLFYPLTCLLDYCGYRLLAVADAGFSQNTEQLVYGPGKRSTKKEPVFIELAKRCSNDLNVSGQSIRGVWNYTSSVLEGYRCLDERFYVTGVNRLLPPQSIDASTVVGTQHTRPRVSHLCWQLRPEFLKRYPISLSSDAFTPGSENTPAYVNALVSKATNYIVQIEIPALAKMLTQDFQFSISQIMHYRGINVRFLGLLVQEVLSVLDKKSKREWTTQIVAEMVRRALKQVARALLRQVSPPTFNALATKAMEFFNTFIFSEDSSALWLDLVCKKFELDPKKPFLDEAQIKALVDVPSLFRSLAGDIGIILNEETKGDSKIENVRFIKGFQVTHRRTPDEIYEKGMATIDLTLPDSDSDSDTQVLPAETRELLLRVSAECFLSSLKTSGIFLDGFNMLGLCLTHLGERKVAEEYFQSALLIYPFQPEPMVNLGDMYSTEKRPLSIIYASGALVRAYDFGIHVESMALRVLQQTSAGTPILSGLIQLATRGLSDAQLESEVESELRQINFSNTDQLFQQSVLMQVANNPKPHKPIETIRGILKSKSILKALVLSIRSSPLSIITLGFINRVIESLKTTKLIPPEDSALIASSLCEVPDSVSGIFDVVEKGVSSVYAQESFHHSAAPIINYYALMALTRLFDTKEGRSLLSPRGVSILVKIIQTSSQATDVIVAMNGLSRITETPWIQQIVEAHPTIADDVTNYLENTNADIAQSSWRFVRSLLKSPAAVSQILASNGGITRRLFDFSSRLVLDCEQVNSLVESGLSPSVKCRNTLKATLKEFIEFLLALVGSPKAEVMSSVAAQASSTTPNWRLKVSRDVIDQKILRKTLQMATLFPEADVVDGVVQLHWNLKDLEGFVAQLDKNNIRAVARVSKEKKLECAGYSHELQQMCVS